MPKRQTFQIFIFADCLFLTLFTCCVIFVLSRCVDCCKIVLLLLSVRPNKTVFLRNFSTVPESASAGKGVIKSGNKSVKAESRTTKNEMLFSSWCNDETESFCEICCCINGFEERHEAEETNTKSIINSFAM